MNSLISSVSVTVVSLFMTGPGLGCKCIKFPFLGHLTKYGFTVYHNFI